MARPRKNSSPAQLSAGQAAYVLDRLVRDRRVTKADVNSYVADMSREISDLERQLAALRAAHGGGGSVSTAAPVARTRRRRGRAAAAPAAKAAAPAKTRKRARRVTPEQKASQRLQGRYLGLVRQFPASRRPYFARVAKEKGREVAIKEMLELKK